MLFISVILYQCWALFIVSQYSLTGIRVDKNDSDQFIVRLVENASSGSKANIRVGDVITAIDGISPENYWSVIRFMSVDQVNFITILEENREVTVPIQSGLSLNYYDVFALVTQLLCLSIALIIYKKVDYVNSSKYLSVVFLMLALIFMSFCPSVRGEPLAKLLLSACLIMIPTAFYRFLMAFLKERGGIELPVYPLKVVSIIMGLLIIIAPVYFINFKISFPIYSFVKLGILLIAVLEFCFIFIKLLSIFLENRKEKNNVFVITKTVFLSLFCAVSPILFLSFVPRIFWGYEWIDSFYLSWFIFIFPLTFIYLMITRRLYDIDLIIRRVLFTTMLALVPSLVFIGLVKLFFIREAESETLVLLFVIMLAGSSFMLYSLENLTSKLEPALFPRKHRLKIALENISKNLRMISTLREMKEVVLGDIVNTLEVSGGAIVFKYKEDKLESIVEGSLEQKEVEELIASGVMEHSSYSFFEVSRQEDYTSYLVVTHKKTATQLGMEEYHWLNLIITYLAVSLENVQLIRKLDERIRSLSSLLPGEENAENLVWFRKLMFEIQEKERVRIAMDVHDTTMQDLFFLKRRLNTMTDKKMLTPAGESEMKSVNNFIDVINDGLRQSCFELHPYLLREIGLIGTLNKLFQMERALSEFEIIFTSSQEAQIEKQDMEVKRHLFRMVQELLNNAKKYSKATRVNFSLGIEKGTVKFEYSDDGVGFEPSRPVVREIGSSGMGMEQIKSRVLSLGGQFELQTGIGKGVLFRADLPAKTGYNLA